MLTVKLVYLGALIVSGVFFVLYRDILALLLFVVIALIPILLLLQVALMRIFCGVSVSGGTNIINKGEKGKVSIRIKNRFILPILKLKVYGTVSNSFLDSRDKAELCFYAAPLSDKINEMDVSSKYAGNVTVELSKARVFDYFGVFSLPIKLGFKRVYSVIPPVSVVEIALSPNIYTLSESNVYSKSKPGDDPSEVFQIRDYVGGDKLNRIHWKLSTKQNQFMVKDYSLPISESVLIALEFCCNPKKEEERELIDVVLEAAASLSYSLLNREIAHSFAWRSKYSNEVYNHKIESLEDIYAGLGIIYNSAAYYPEPLMARLDAEHQQNMSHVIYIAPNITEQHTRLIEGTKLPSCIYALLDCISPDSKPQVVSNDEFTVLPVRSDNVAYSFNHTII